MITIWFGFLMFVLSLLFLGGLCHAAKIGDERMEEALKNEQAI